MSAFGGKADMTFCATSWLDFRVPLWHLSPLSVISGLKANLSVLANVARRAAFHERKRNPQITDEVAWSIPEFSLLRCDFDQANIRVVCRPPPCLCRNCPKLPHLV